MSKIWYYPQQVRVARFTSTNKRDRPMFIIWHYHQQVRVARFTPAAIWLTPTLHFDQQSASSLIGANLHTFFLYLLLQLPFLPLTSRSNALLKTRQCHRTQFAMADRSLFSFKPRMSIKSVHRFSSLSCTPQFSRTMDLSVLPIIPFSLSFRHNNKQTQA